MPGSIRWVYDCANYSHAVPRRWVRRHGFKTWSGIHSFLLNFNVFLKFTAILFESASVLPRVIQSSLRDLTLLRCGSERRVALEYFEWINVGIMSTKLPKMSRAQKEMLFLINEKRKEEKRRRKKSPYFPFSHLPLRLYIKLDKLTCSCKERHPHPPLLI